MSSYKILSIRCRTCITGRGLPNSNWRETSCDQYAVCVTTYIHFTVLSCVSTSIDLSFANCMQDSNLPSQIFVRVLPSLGSPLGDRLLSTGAVKPLCYEHEDFQRHLFGSVTPFDSVDMPKRSAPIVVGTRGVRISCSTGSGGHFLR